MSSYRMKYKIGNTEFITTVPADVQQYVINKRTVITTSGTWSAPVTGWFKFTLIGGGGGGCSGVWTNSGSYLCGGGGAGGAGGIKFAFAFLQKDSTVSVWIGAGGAGGAKPTTQGIIGVTGVQNSGSNGGSTTLTINGTTYTATGGNGGNYVRGGSGGSGDIDGLPGMPPNKHFNSGGRECYGGAGQSAYSPYGNGGYGGNGYTDKIYVTAGTSGVNGAVIVEYFDPTL